LNPIGHSYLLFVAAAAAAVAAVAPIFNQLEPD
jgi:hypothetical protein